MMSNSIQPAVNALFQQSLPRINVGIDQDIRANHLDPLGHLASGSAHLGPKNIGLCTAPAIANVMLGITKGLSQLKITKLSVASLQPKNPSNTLFYGTLSMQGIIQDIQSYIRGGIRASCDLLHPSAGLGGTFDVRNNRFSSSGEFTMVVSGKDIAITEITTHPLSLNVGVFNANISVQDVFSRFIPQIEEYAKTTLFIGQGVSTIQNALSNTLHSEFQKLVPLQGMI